MDGDRPGRAASASSTCCGWRRRGTCASSCCSATSTIPTCGWRSTPNTAGARSTARTAPSSTDAPISSSPARRSRRRFRSAGSSWPSARRRRSTSSTSTSRRWRRAGRPVRYQRLAERAYRRTAMPTGAVRQFDVDEFGLVVDEAERFRRDQRLTPGSVPAGGCPLVQPGDESGQLGAELGPAHHDRDRRLDVAERRAGVVALDAR